MIRLINIKGGKQATFSSERTILEAIENEGVVTEAQCRDGHCGACRCKLIRGEVEYVKAPLAFIAKGDFLPCSTKPLTDIDIEIP